VSTNNNNNSQQNSTLCNEINDEINVLEYEMLLHMAQLDKVELNENSIDNFFLRIADVQLKINNIRKKCSPNNNFVNLSTLPMYYNNMRSIVNKRNICMKIELSFFKVICFTETWLTSEQSSSVYFPKNFDVYRCDRATEAELNSRSRRSGGVAVLVHTSLPNQQVTLNDDPDCECLAIEIRLKPTPILLYVCYMKIFDISVANKHYVNIKSLMIRYTCHQVIILGDFNMKNLQWVPDETETCFVPIILRDSQSSYLQNALAFLNDMFALPLYQLSNIQNSASNVLDLLFVNNSNDINLCVDQFTLVDKNQQDEYHVPYEITFEYCKTETNLRAESKRVYKFQRGNYERLCQQIEAINFQHEFNCRDVHSAFEFFHRTMTTLTENNVPKVSVTSYPNKPKWWTRQLQQKKNRRDKLYKRKPKGILTVEYIEACDEFNELNDTLHKQYIDRIQSNIKLDPAEFWKFAKIGSKQSSYPNRMFHENNTAHSPEEIVQLFANYFESIYEADDQPFDFNDIFHEVADSNEIDVSLINVELAITSLKWHSGAGPDEISPFVVKKCIDAITWPIWLLYQKTFDTGTIPHLLKLSRVVPVFKKGKKDDVTNYRVIAISSVILKIFELAMKYRLSEIVDPQLSNTQHGFRARRSVTTNLLNLSIFAHNAFKERTQLDVFYGDFKNAFDRVWHRKLIEKLAQFKIGRKSAKWLCEFVVNRFNYVKIDQYKSRSYPSPSGVPAGSVLGPILFTMFINDITRVVDSSKILLLADDIKVAIEIRGTATSNNSRRLQSDIDSIIDWCNDNKLFFNNQKCAIVTISRKNSPIIVNYTMGNHIIERKDEIRDLGVQIDRKLHFGHHIELKTIQARRMIGCIKHFSNGNFTKETQKILYLAHVRPILEFASVIWSPYQEIYINDIESIQKQFIIYLLESRRNATSYRLAPYIDRCKLLKIQPLVLRREVADAVFAYDVFKYNINDQFIISKFVRNEYFRENVNNQLLDVPFYSTDYSREQPIARLIRSINNFRIYVNINETKESFRSNVVKILLSHREGENENNQN